jgi:DNA-binding FadR family transcriptional regulator
VHRYYLSAPAVVQRRREVLKEHAKLIAALESGDQEALEQAIRYHVHGTREHLQKSLVDAGPDESETAGIL